MGVKEERIKFEAKAKREAEKSKKLLEKTKELVASGEQKIL